MSELIKFLGRHSLKIFLAFLALGLAYRILFLKNQPFDIFTFLAYSITALVLLLIDRFADRVLNKNDIRYDTHADRRTFDNLPSSSKRWFMFYGVLLGVSFAFLKGIPFICVYLPPLMALYGYDQFYNLIELLKLDFFPTTIPRLIFLTVWFITGSAISHVEVSLAQRYWLNVRRAA